MSNDEQWMNGWWRRLDATPFVDGERPCGHIPLPSALTYTRTLDVLRRDKCRPPMTWNLSVLSIPHPVGTKQVSVTELQVFDDKET